MKKELRSKADLFLKNKKIFKNEVKFESESYYLLNSFLYIDANKEVDPNRLRGCNKIFKENTRLLSDLRIMSFLLITKMSLSKDPLKYLNNVKENYELVTNRRMFGSMYKILSALILCDTKNVDFEKVHEREMNIYNLMKKKHPFLTGEEDLPFAILLALTNKNEKDIIKDMEECYDVLSKKFSYKNEVQTLSQILALYNINSSDKVNRVIEIYDLLIKNKKKINLNFGIPVLGTLLSINKDSKEIVDDIIEVDNYLGSKKGTGLWPYGKSTRLIFAMLIVESTYGSNMVKSGKNAILVSSTIAQIIAEEIIATMLIMDLVILSD